MKNTDKTTVKLSFSLIKSYAEDDIAVPEPPVEEAIEEENDEEVEFFSKLITDKEVEDEEFSEPLAVDKDDEEQPAPEPEVVEVPTAEVTPEPEPEIEPEPVVEQPKGSEEPPKEEAIPEDVRSFEEDLEAYKGELQNQYAISEEDAEQILTDPQVVLPKLMSNMHILLLQQVASMMQSNMPKLIETTVKQTTERDSKLEKFSQKYPNLVAKENEQIAATALKTIKQLHPNITFDEMLEKVGPIADALMGKQPAPTPEPVASVPKPKPHIPARGTSTATTPVKPKGDAMSSFIDNLIG